MRICGGVLLLSLLMAAGNAGAQSLSGTVFDDRDGDGRQDRREFGIADVALSNGRSLVSIVCTGAAGQRHRPPGRPRS